MNQELDYETAYDIADTIVHYRQNGAFPTKELMKDFIKTEIKIKSNINRLQVALITEELVAKANEWYDKECQPDWEE